MALEELPGKTHKQATIIRLEMPGWGGHRGGAPTLSTAVGEEQSEEGHKENVRPMQYMSVRRRQYYGVSKAGETTASGKEPKSPHFQGGSI